MTGYLLSVINEKSLVILKLIDRNSYRCIDSYIYSSNVSDVKCNDRPCCFRYLSCEDIRIQDAGDKKGISGW